MGNLTPDYITLLDHYKKVPCPWTGLKHSVCKNVSAAGRLLRSPIALDDFNRSQENILTPAGMQIDHIVPLCLGGPDCVCNMQYLTESEHREKTRRDLKACFFFKVKL